MSSSSLSVSSLAALPRTPSFSLRGKRALVTGASRGLGLAAAAALAQADAEVCCVARNKEDLEQVARACAEQGWKVQAEVLDVLDRDRFLSSSLRRCVGEQCGDERSAAEDHGFEVMVFRLTAESGRAFAKCE